MFLLMKRGVKQLTQSSETQRKGSLAQTKWKAHLKDPNKLRNEWPLSL